MHPRRSNPLLAPAAATVLAMLLAACDGDAARSAPPRRGSQPRVEAEPAPGAPRPAATTDVEPSRCARPLPAVAGSLRSRGAAGISTVFELEIDPRRAAPSPAAAALARGAGSTRRPRVAPGDVGLAAATR